MKRIRVSTGTPWEESVGYSRAVRSGRHVFVCGTTSSDESGRPVAAGDAYRQTQFILKKIEAALNEAGATLKDVVRTRMFVTDIRRWQEMTGEQAVHATSGEPFDRCAAMGAATEGEDVTDVRE